MTPVEGALAGDDIGRIGRTQTFLTLGVLRRRNLAPGQLPARFLGADQLCDARRSRGQSFAGLLAAARQRHQVMLHLRWLADFRGRN